MLSTLPDILLDKSQIYYHTDIVINYAELLHDFDYTLWRTRGQSFSKSYLTR